MAALPSVAVIVTGANLDPKNIPQVETLVEEFTNLSPTERDNERGSFVEKAFPLFFDENAVVHGSSAYEAQRQVPWSTACWLQPRVVVLPRSAKQVGTTLSLCRFFGIKFSIHGGGHSPSIGWSSNDGGVVISLAAFDQVKLSGDKLTADIGVGLRWLDVYKALDHYDLAVAGEGLAVPGHVCHDFRTMSSQPSLEVYETVERVRVEQEGLLSDVEELRISNVIQPMSSISIKQSREVSGNPLGLEEVGQQWFLAMADWNNPADGGHVRQAMRHIVDAVEATAKANGTYLPYHYCNYASPDQDPLASYGTENLEKLREIASKVGSTE
ncbi:hypothetical protein RU639_010782 [Aspergillus parasiticus]